MQYQLVNRYYGTKMISPSKEHCDRFLNSCKKDPKDNQPVWAIGKELPDPQEDRAARKEALLAELAAMGVEDLDAEAYAGLVDTELEDLKREYLLKTGKDAHPNATVKSLTKKLEELDS